LFDKVKTKPDRITKYRTAVPERRSRASIICKGGTYTIRKKKTNPQSLERVGE